MHIDKTVYGTLWPGLGSEFVMGMDFWDWVKNRPNWTGKDGVLDWRDLNIDSDAFIIVEQAVSALAM